MLTLLKKFNNLAARLSIAELAHPNLVTTTGFDDKLEVLHQKKTTQRKQNICSLKMNWKN